MLPAQHRLRHRSAIQRVRRDGRRWHHPLFVLFVAPNGAAISRFAVSASRHTGNAVIRNRLKRRMREALRPYLPSVQGGYDCLLVARQPLGEATFAEIESALKQLLQRAALLPDGFSRPCTDVT
ncbi:MAG: ribonuclease P protein component [Chloroflexi bacterium]|nr:ribonuclease P protein component [Chloroflexota bacterium]